MRLGLHETVAEPGRGGPRENRPHVVDFGLARLVKTGTKLTRTGEALGTPTYMSPEQARGETPSLTPATDVWSLGCLLHEMVAGRPPFEGESAAAIVAKALLAAPPSLGRIRRGVPRGLEAVVRTCLAKRAGDRYRDGRALREDLERLLQGRRPRARVPRSHAWWAAVTGMVAAGATGAAALLGGGDGSPGRLPGPVPAEPAAVGLERRAWALRQSDPRMAARLLDEALAAAPARHDWRVERGLLLWAVGQGPAARQEWRKVSHASPHASRARLYLGLESLFRFDVHEAQADLAEEAAGGGREARVARGAQATLENRWPEARAALAGVSGWEAGLLRGYVESLDLCGDRAAAVREYDQALSEGPAFAWAICNRGVAKSKLGNLHGAVEDFETALRLEPEAPTALNGRGEARHGLAELGGALADYDAALRLRPDYPEALNNRGNLRRETGDSRGALEDYDRAILLDPENPLTLSNRGQARRDLGDLRGAIEDFDSALRRRPDYPEALLGRGAARGESGDNAGAIEDYDAALRLRPDDPGALTGRGASRAALGDPSGAIGDFEEALRLEPGLALAHANLGIARRNLAEWSLAAESFREFLRLAPSDARAEKVRRCLAECEAKIAGQETARR
ncbi:MAG: tetratricopeptide repeat protein [Planctomycetales bacterium]|nr:tetratricopeptide repeat protein [Planctomycetales bacterium]